MLVFWVRIKSPNLSEHVSYICLLHLAHIEFVLRQANFETAYLNGIVKTWQKNVFFLRHQLYSKRTWQKLYLLWENSCRWSLKEQYHVFIYPITLFSQNFECFQESVESFKGAQAWEFFVCVFCTNWTHLSMWLRDWTKKSIFLSFEPWFRTFLVFCRILSVR
jgi:hypothetical protein